MGIAFIFPGQGSQKVGMASVFTNAFKTGYETLQEIEDAVSIKISDVIENGPIEELTKTQNAQLAIFAVSMICFRVLEREFGLDVSNSCKYLAGHSLGEYSALCASGCIDLQSCAKLVRFRGELMANAFPDTSDCAMAAVIGLKIEDIEDVVEPYSTGERLCVIANDNSSSQVVLSGHKDKVLEAGDKLKQEKGAFKVIQLNTSGPFHSPLMTNAMIELDDYISSNITFNKLKVPVIMNIVGKQITDSSEIHALLLNQITGRVQWRKTMDIIVNDKNVDKIVEVAPGKVLSSMAKRDYPERDFVNLESISQIEAFMKG